MTPFRELRTTTAAELLKHPPEPRRLILEPWLKERDAVMLFAPTGAGKSQVAMSAALAVAGGCEVLGWKAPRPLPVLFVDGEMDRGDLVERIGALSQTTRPQTAEAGWLNLHILARDLHSPEVPFPDIGKGDAGHTAVLAAAQETGAKLVILDNLSTLATIEDENSAASIKRPLELVQKLRQMGCATMLVHHAGKGGESYRGSSNIATTFAWIIGLTPSKTAPPGTLDVSTKWVKTRGAANAATVPQRLRLVEGPQGPRWEVGEDENDQAARLVRAIRSRQFPTLKAAGDSIGLKRSRASEVMGIALAEGLMTAGERVQCFKEAADGIEGGSSRDPEEPGF